jgi:hypothetical protein
MNTHTRYLIASRGLLLLLSLTILFHVLVLSRVVPYDIVWGGRLTSTRDMLQFETVSILINGLMLLVVLIHTGSWKVPLSRTLTRALLWGMCALFLLNTVGNLFSINQWERLIFTPLTLLLSLFCLQLALPDPRMGTTQKADRKPTLPEFEP